MNGLRICTILSPLVLASTIAVVQPQAAEGGGPIQVAQSQQQFDNLLAQPRAIAKVPPVNCEQIRQTLSAHRAITPQFGDEEPPVQVGEVKLPEEQRDEILKIQATAPTLEAQEITFEFNSAELTKEGRGTVQRLGEAIRRAAGQVCLGIYGHTDAIGTEQYNDNLSERRAAAVKDFLTSNFNVRDDDLVVVGYGEKRLKYPNKPDHPENRRVELQNLLGG